MSRVTRVLSLAIPLLAVGVFVLTGGWRVHDGQIERVSHHTEVAAPAAPQVMPQATTPAGEQASFVQHLSPSVPWPVWVGLMVLCILPAVGTMAAWSGSRRSREASYL